MLDVFGSALMQQIIWVHVCIRWVHVCMIGESKQHLHQALRGERQPLPAQAEINLFRKKGGHIYTTASSSRLEPSWELGVKCHQYPLVNW